MVELTQKYAYEAGLQNVSLQVSEYEGYYDVLIHSDNFHGTDWDTLMTMYQKINDLHENWGTRYEQDNWYYFFDPENDEISGISPDFDYDIYYDGSWSNSRKDHGYDGGAVREDINDRLDDKISNEKCEVCGEKAKERIDTEYYCSKHYEEAFVWYVEQALKSKE